MKTDFLVIGSGIAGLNFALRASKYGKVIVVTKKKMMESNTNYAQGGIAAVHSEIDSWKSHYNDTLKAGAYHNDKKAVRFLVTEGPRMINRLASLGVNFDSSNGNRRLTKEGGHSFRRIAFCRDTTGHSIEKVLVENVKRNKNIKVMEGTVAFELIVKGKKCYAAQALKGHSITNIFAKATILATGGAGKVFKNSTNPEISTGDGIALAYRAGCRLKDLEFVQFHPTALKLEGAPPFLISEAVRGEGAYLVHKDGKRFMHKYHKLGELAPRDIVSRAIVNEEKKGQVYLDITHKDPSFVRERFPKICKSLKKYGLDIAKDKIPVSPAAHYMCGGVKVNINGETNIKNLFAFGEVACTGVHGANRLASNSLLEAVVFSNQILKVLKALKGKIEEFIVKMPLYKNSKSYEHIKTGVQQIMWKNVGIIRKKKGLEAAVKELALIEQKLNKEYVSQSLIEARNLATTGRLIAQAALKRRKSLGAHYRVD